MKRQDAEDLVIDFSKVLFTDAKDTNSNKPLSDATSGSVNAQVTGRRTQSLEEAFKEYADNVNKAARNNSGEISGRPADKLKGNIYEAQQKSEYNIDATAKGKADQTRAYMGGDTGADGKVISTHDQTTDIKIQTQDNPWGKVREKPYQAKTGKTAQREISNLKYKDVEHVGPKGQVADGNTISDKVGSKTISSDPTTPEELDKLTRDAKEQKVKYPEQKKHQKRGELNRLNVIDATKTGALIGGVSAAVHEIIDIVKNGKSLTQEQFTASIEHVISGTADGATRGAATVLATQIFNVQANTLKAVPAMAGANIAVSLGEDLYRFARGKIEADELLTNTVGNTLTSFGGLFGGWAGGQATGALMSSVSCANTAAIGASIGTPFGPLGVVIGSVVGGVIIGGAVNMVIKDAKKDGQRMYAQCVENLRREVERDPSMQMMKFADAMSSLEDYNFSFKSLIPCHDFFSNMEEYHLKKKAIKDMQALMDNRIAGAKAATYERMMKIYEAQRNVIIDQFHEAQGLMQRGFESQVKASLVASYQCYVENYALIGRNIAQTLDALERQEQEQNEVLRLAKNRVAANRDINEMMTEITQSGSDKDISAIMGALTELIKSDTVTVGKQYVSASDVTRLLETV